MLLRVVQWVVPTILLLGLGSGCDSSSVRQGETNSADDQKVFFVGFDGSPPLVNALRAGKIQGLVLQNPRRMGYLGVQSLIDHLEGREVEPIISTGEILVTPENMGSAEFADLLDPPKIGHSGDSNLSGAKSKRWRLMVIPKGTTHEFWQTIHAGAKEAAEERDAEILWLGPQKEDDRQQQIDLLKNAVAIGIEGKIDGIVLAPLDARALVGPVEEAMDREIPVVIIDSALASDRPVSFVATDNYNGGVIAARRLGELLQGQGRAILLRYAQGSASTDDRERGFLETMRAEFPEIQFVSDNQYAGATAAKAQEVSRSLVTRYRGSVDGIFAPNESSSFGMLRALEDAGMLKDGR